jgi:L-rhamnonate dehydratase
MKVLRQRTYTRIAAGQRIPFRWNQKYLILNDAVDIAQFDVVHVGGFSEGFKVGHLAETYHLKVATHGWPRLNSHLIATLSDGLVEYHSRGDGLDQVLYEEVIDQENSSMRMPDGPGLGLTPRQDYLKDTLIKG